MSTSPIGPLPQEILDTQQELLNLEKSRNPRRGAPDPHLAPILDMIVENRLSYFGELLTLLKAREIYWLRIRFPSVSSGTITDLRKVEAKNVQAAIDETKKELSTLETTSPLRGDSELCTLKESRAQCLVALQALLGKIAPSQPSEDFSPGPGLPILKEAFSPPNSALSSPPIAPLRSPPIAPLHSPPVAPLQSSPMTPLQSFLMTPLHSLSIASLQSPSMAPLRSFLMAPLQSPSMASLQSPPIAPLCFHSMASLQSPSKEPLQSSSMAPLSSPPIEIPRNQDEGSEGFF